MTKVVYAEFTVVEEDGLMTVTAPKDYWKERGKALFHKIMAGNEEGFYQLVPLTESNAQAVAIRLHCDYAVWKGTQSLLAGLG